VRGIAQAEARVKEAGKLGFDRCILPTSNLRQLDHIKAPDLIGVTTVKELWQILFDR
jgi:DNA repair protein RadA/Sms